MNTTVSYNPQWQVPLTGYYPGAKLVKKRPLAKNDFNAPKHEIDSFTKNNAP